MRGFWQSSITKLNRHYQSGGGASSPSGSYSGDALAAGNHYIGLTVGKKWRATSVTFSCEGVTADHVVYSPSTAYNSVSVVFGGATIQPTGATSPVNIVAPSYGTSYDVYVNGNVVDTITADFTDPLRVTLSGMTRVYDSLAVNALINFNIGLDYTYTLTIT